MRRIIAGILAAVLAAGLAGCRVPFWDVHFWRKALAVKKCAKYVRPQMAALLVIICELVCVKEKYYVQNEKSSKLFGS